MLYESVVQESIISLLQNKGCELIDENDNMGMLNLNINLVLNRHIEIRKVCYGLLMTIMLGMESI